MILNKRYIEAILPPELNVSSGEQLQTFLIQSSYGQKAVSRAIRVHARAGPNSPFLGIAKSMRPCRASLLNSTDILLLCKGDTKSQNRNSNRSQTSIALATA